MSDAAAKATADFRGLPVLAAPGGGPRPRATPEREAIRAALIAERIVAHASPEALILALTRLSDIQAGARPPKR